MDWKEWQENVDWSVVYDRLNNATAAQRFEQVNPADVPDSEITNVYRFDKDEYDFSPFLRPERQRVDRNTAFAYLLYRKWARRHGQEPSEFVDLKKTITAADL